jgi:hypothetical protein
VWPGVPSSCVVPVRSDHVGMGSHSRGNAAQHTLPGVVRACRSRRCAQLSLAVARFYFGPWPVQVWSLVASPVDPAIFFTCHQAQVRVAAARPPHRRVGQSAVLFGVCVRALLGVCVCVRACACARALVCLGVFVCRYTCVTFMYARMDTRM